MLVATFDGSVGIVGGGLTPFIEFQQRRSRRDPVRREVQRPLVILARRLDGHPLVIDLWLLDHQPSGIRTLFTSSR